MRSLARTLLAATLLAGALTAMPAVAQNYNEPSTGTVANSSRLDQARALRDQSLQTGWNTWVPNNNVGGAQGLLYAGHVRMQAANGRSILFTGNSVELSSGLPLSLPASNVTIGSGSVTITTGSVQIGNGNLTTSSGNITTSSGNISTSAGSVTAPNGNITALTTGTLTVNNSVSANFYYHSSDRTLKSDLARVDGLSILRGLTGYTYRFTDEGRASAGILAQDLQPLLPQLVTTNPATGKLQVEYSGLFAPVIEGIKTLDIRSAGTEAAVDNLENRIARLERLVNALETENASLRAQIELGGVRKASN